MINLKRIYTGLLVAYSITSLLVPLAIYNKLIYVIMIVVYGSYLFFVKKKDKLSCFRFTIAPIIIAAVFLYGFVLGMLKGADMALARQFLVAVGILILIYPIAEFEIDFNDLLKRIAPAYIMLFGLYSVWAMKRGGYNLPLPVYKIVDFMDNELIRTIGETIFELGEGRASHRALFGTDGMKISIGSIPFLLILTDILYIDFLKNKRKIQILWVICAILMTLITGSRALMLLLPISLCLITWLYLGTKWRVLMAGSVAIAGGIVFFLLLNHSVFFSFADGSSNFIKLHHIFSYLKKMTLGDALFGQGMATYYYSTGTGYEMAHTEITLLDHLRWFGIPAAGLVWGLLLIPKPSKRLKECLIPEVKFEVAVFLVYLLFAQTNPVLFNSFGLMSVLWYWSVMLEKTQKGTSTC